MTAGFTSVALFVWSRHRLLIITCAMIYVAIYFASEIIWTEAGALLLQPALTFLRLAPFFIPLALFISPASIASLNIARSESAFPKYLFTLPASARELVLPFMAYGALTAALLWTLAIGLTGGRVLLAGPLDGPPEVLQRQTWSPFLWLALLVWTQALIWRPFHHGWVRVLVLLALIVAHAVLLVAAIHEAVSGGAVIVLSLVQILLASVVAVRGVRRARHGEGTTASPRSKASSVHTAPADRRTQTLPPTRPPHRSPLSALVLHDLRLHGRAVTIVITALVCAPVLIMALVLGHGGRAGGSQAIAGQLVFVAAAMLALASLGPLFGNFASSRYRAFPMPSFFASLPLSTGDFAWAKLMASALHIGLISLLILAVAAGAAAVAGVDPAWHVLMASLADRYGPAAAVILAVLAVSWLIAWTVGMAMNGVWVGLSGRKQAWHAVNVAIVAILFATVMGAHWLSTRPDAAHSLLESVPRLLMVAATLKLALLAGLAYLAGARRLYPWSRLVGVCAAWSAAVAGGVMLALRFLPAGAVTTPTVLWILIVITPGLGIVAAPLALAWNRNR